MTECNVRLPECTWCHSVCDVPENTRVRPSHDSSEERTFCSRSCESAYLNG